MDVRRISIIAALAIVSYVMILKWSEDFSSSPVQPTVVSTSTVVGESNEVVNSEIPSGNVDTSVSTSQPTEAAHEPSDQVRVRTNTLDVLIDLIGGDVVYAALPAYPFSIDEQEIPFQILETTQRTFLAQSGLVGKDGIDSKTRAVFTSPKKEYSLANGSVDVELSHQADNGMLVKKVFTFTESSYLINVKYIIENVGTQTLQTNLFAQLRRDDSEDPSASSGVGMRSYVGATFSTAESPYQKVKFGDMEDEKFQETSQGGWVAMIQHYFLSAWIPAENDKNAFYGQQGSNGDFYAGYQAPTIEIGPGETITTGAQLYVGPKDQDSLAEIATNLEKTVDYGWLWWIAQPLFMVMKFIHGLVGNWGWSIVLLTITVKSILYPLTAASYRSMAKMRKFAPKIQELREQFGDDRQKMSQEMMKLYSKEKLNPLGGCLPMLVQMPIFIALYWTLMESVELRQSPFMFWIVDLSIKDPWFVLPLLMGASMFIQMQMQQQPTMDPMQAKIMKLMPIMFTFMFLWFPAGLTLYWFTNNTITIIQQYTVNKSVERADLKEKK